LTAGVKILEEVFRSMLQNKFYTDDNFDIIVNLNQGDLEIWRFREVVDDDSEDIWEHDKISLTEAIKIEPNFNIGEEVAQPPVAQLSYLVAQPPVAQL